MAPFRIYAVVNHCGRGVQRDTFRWTVCAQSPLALRSRPPVRRAECGWSTLQVRMALSQVAPCTIGRQRHVCVEVDNPPHVGTGPKGEGMIAVRGL